MVGQRDPITGAQLGESVGELAIGIELPGQIERAHAPVDHQRDPGSASRPLDELGVEARRCGR